MNELIWFLYQLLKEVLFSILQIKTWSFGILVAARHVQWIYRFSLWRKYQRCDSFRYKTSLSRFRWYLRDPVGETWWCPPEINLLCSLPYSSVYWVQYTRCSWGYPNEHCPQRASVVHMSTCQLCVCTFCMHARFYNKLLGRQWCILENDNQMRTKRFQLKNIDCFMDLHDVSGHGNHERDFSQGCL